MLVTLCFQCVDMLLIAAGFMFVSVLSLGCDDSVIGDALREVLSMLDEVCVYFMLPSFLNFYLHHVHNWSFRYCWLHDNNNNNMQISIPP